MERDCWFHLPSVLQICTLVFSKQTYYDEEDEEDEDEDEDDEDDDNNDYDDDWNAVDCRWINQSQPYHTNFVETLVYLWIPVVGQSCTVHFWWHISARCVSLNGRFLLGNHPIPVATDNHCFTRRWFSPALSLSPRIEKTENSNHFWRVHIFSSRLDDWVSCVEKLPGLYLDYAIQAFYDGLTLLISTIMVAELGGMDHRSLACKSWWSGVIFVPQKNTTDVDLILRKGDLDGTFMQNELISGLWTGNLANGFVYDKQNDLYKTPNAPFANTWCWNLWTLGGFPYKP